MILVYKKEERNKIKEAISNFKNKDINIKYIFTEPNLYQAKNTNQGLKSAVGKYIRILHSDDIISNDCIEKEIDFFEKNDDIDILYHNFIEFINIKDIIFKNKRETKIEFINSKLWLNESIFTNTIIPSCLCFKKLCLKKLAVCMNIIDFYAIGKYFLIF